MNWLRMRFGLRWKGSRPPAKWWGILVVILAVLGTAWFSYNWWAHRHEQFARLKTAMVGYQTQMIKYRSLFDTCLNGGVVGLDRTSKTALTCRGAEEFYVGTVNLIGRK